MSWLTRSIHDEPRRELPMLRLVIGSEAHLEGCSCEHSSCLPFLTRVLVKEKEVGKDHQIQVFARSAIKFDEEISESTSQP